MKPLIGLTIQYRYEESRVHFHDRIIRVIEWAGGTPILLPETPSEEDAIKYSEICDGFFFTGGFDIEPWRYGEETLPECGMTAGPRDAFEFMLFPHALKTGRPILGVCRGIQTLNVALGGSLYQDIKTTGHNEIKHLVNTVEGSRVREIFGAERFETNTYHHQAIKKLGDGLVITATTDDGIVEAIELPTHKFFVGLQWHPEVSWERDKEETYSPKIFHAFIDACK